MLTLYLVILFRLKTKYLSVHVQIDPVFHQESNLICINVGCGELNIINKHLERLEKPVGCSELSVEPR